MITTHCRIFLMETYQCIKGLSHWIYHDQKLYTIKRMWESLKNSKQDTNYNCITKLQNSMTKDIHDLSLFLHDVHDLSKEKCVVSILIHYDILYVKISSKWLTIKLVCNGYLSIYLICYSAIVKRKMWSVHIL